jgi:sporulation protein YlmC with PRC-barrel domain
MRRFLKIAMLAVGCAFIAAATQVRLRADESAPEPTTSRVSDLLSMPIYGAANEKLGKVEDLVLDPSSGKIRYAVLSFGEILGMGGKYFAVPWNDVRVLYKGATSAGTQKIVYCSVDVSKEALKNAPGFDKNQWPNFADPTFVRDIDSFYGSNRAAAKIQGQTR